MLSVQGDVLTSHIGVVCTLYREMYQPRILLVIISKGRPMYLGSGGRAVDPRTVIRGDGGSIPSRGSCSSLN